MFILNDHNMTIYNVVSVNVQGIRGISNSYDFGQEGEFRGTAITSGFFPVFCIEQ